MKQQYHALINVCIPVRLTLLNEREVPSNELHRQSSHGNLFLSHKLPPDSNVKWVTVEECPELIIHVWR